MVYPEDEQEADMVVKKCDNLCIEDKGVVISAAKKFKVVEKQIKPNQKDGENNPENTSEFTQRRGRGYGRNN